MIKLLENFYRYLQNIDHKINFLSYNSLFSSIPKSWRSSIIDYAPFDNEVSETNLIIKFMKSEKPSKFVYNILCSKIKQVPENSQQKWQLNNWFEPDRTWEDIYSLPHLCTSETKLISFQYNILHRTIFTNDRLFRANLHGSIMCSFCNIQFETLEHLFFFCNETRNLYIRLSEWIQQNTDIKIELTPSNYIFGINSSTLDNEALNTIILLAKRFIYIQRCNGSTQLEFQSLKNFICHRISIEQISFKTTKTRIFENKYRNFVHFIK